MLDPSTFGEKKSSQDLVLIKKTIENGNYITIQFIVFFYFIVKVFLKISLKCILITIKS